MHQFSEIRMSEPEQFWIQLGEVCNYMTLLGFWTAQKSKKDT